MKRWLRRLVVVALVAAAIGAVMKARSRLRTPPAAPPFRPQPVLTAVPTMSAEAGPGVAAGPAPDVADLAPSAEGATPSTAWVAPVDGTCPISHPIKANDNSGIYHVPSGRHYARVTPERCYADEDAAVADGYRRAKA